MSKHSVTTINGEFGKYGVEVYSDNTVEIEFTPYCITEHNHDYVELKAYKLKELQNTKRGSHRLGFDVDYEFDGTEIKFIQQDMYDIDYPHIVNIRVEELNQILQIIS